jgi:hypothetical protein
MWGGWKLTDKLMHTAGMLGPYYINSSVRAFNFIGLNDKRIGGLRGLLCGTTAWIAGFFCFRASRLLSSSNQRIYVYKTLAHVSFFQVFFFK